MEERLIKLGIEKVKKFNENFDEMYESYKKKAEEKGLSELKFIREKGKVLIYAVTHI